MCRDYFLPFNNHEKPAILVNKIRPDCNEKIIKEIQTCAVISFRKSQVMTLT